MEEDAAFRRRVLELLWAGGNELAPDGVELLQAQVESTITVLGPSGLGTRAVPALHLRYRCRGREGQLEFPLDGLFWGGSDEPEHIVNYVWIELDEHLNAVE